MKTFIEKLFFDILFASWIILGENLMSSLQPSTAAGLLSKGVSGLLGISIAGQQNVQEATLATIAVRADRIQKSVEELNREIAELRKIIQEQQSNFASQQNPEVKICKLTEEERKELWKMRRQIDALLLAEVESFDDDNCIG